MNKYTLKFLDESLNTLYEQKHSQTQIQFKLTSVINLTCIIVGIADLVDGPIDNGQLDKMISLFITIFSILQQGIILKFRQYTRISLFFANMAMILIQLEISSDDNAQFGFLLGANQMMVHAVILVLSPFYIAVISNIILGISRLLLTLFMTTTGLAVSVYLYTILGTVFFMFILYQMEKEKKMQFLLQLKGSTLDVIYPKIIQKPFYAFILQKETMQLEQTLLVQTEFIKLHDLLNGGYVKLKLLKHFIYEQISGFQKMKEQFYTTSFQFKLNEQKQMATFLAFQLDQNYYILTVDSMDHNLQIAQEQFNTLNSKQKVYFNNVIKKIGYITQKVIMERNLKLATKLRLSLIQIQQSIYMSPFHLLETIEIRQFMKKFLRFSYKLGYKIEYEEETHLKIILNRRYFAFFLIEILKTIGKHQYIQLKLRSEDNVAYLNIVGIIREPRTKVYQTCFKALVENFEKHENSFHYQFYKESLIKYYQINSM